MTRIIFALNILLINYWRNNCVYIKGDENISEWQEMLSNHPTISGNFGNPMQI